MVDAIIMSKPGISPQYKVHTVWSAPFAYAIGLLTTDGSLSIDKRHIDFTSKDREQIVNFMRCLNIKCKIGKKSSGFIAKKSYRVQFGDIHFYNFLLNIGLKPNKSKTLKALEIPKKYFLDFLRGFFDGDGSFYSYWDTRWRSSFMFYLVFASASSQHINWLQTEINTLLQIKGHITKSITDSCYQLKYAKRESLILLKKLYYAKDLIYLNRKHRKIKTVLMNIKHPLGNFL